MDRRGGTAISQFCEYCELDEDQQGRLRCRICKERLALAARFDGAVEALRDDFDELWDERCPSADAVATVSADAAVEYRRVCTALWFHVAAQRMPPELPKLVRSFANWARSHVEDDRSREAAFVQAAAELHATIEVRCRREVAELGFGDDVADQVVAEVTRGREGRYFDIDVAAVDAAVDGLAETTFSSVDLAKVVELVFDVGSELVSGGGVALYPRDVEKEMKRAADEHAGGDADQVFAQMVTRWRGLGGPGGS